MHAREGQLPDGYFFSSSGWVEVMGLMTGRVEGNTMIVLDAYALPVQGEAAFVTAQNSGHLFPYSKQTSTWLIC